jgi:hypothetical protein
VVIRLVGDLDPLETEFLDDPAKGAVLDPSFTMTISTRGKRRRSTERRESTIVLSSLYAGDTDRAGERGIEDDVEILVRRSAEAETDFPERCR